MQTQLTVDSGKTTKENIVKPAGPNQASSSDSRDSIVQTTDGGGVRSIPVISPPQYPVIREQDRAARPSQDEDFEMLMQRHKPTLDLLAQ
ncbi:hypothetical protein [Methanosphaerula palustris]|uniref:Uncharacterized protein n=1 Tax=Methanosphaerula palustris (strain ATCC BAA-1556 / DSM 19958 / E1-9c) TaxID=521011 RepID=B8GHV5_METPE|nr:hypothetical protein [Methanosphaerula palustris]ACL16695.1 hypothetical protein Mpal_1364 [Methanosphaerula palustris E1-9c]